MKRKIFAGVIAVVVLAFSAVAVTANDGEQPTKESDIVKPQGDPGGLG